MEGYSSRRKSKKNYLKKKSTIRRKKKLKSLKYNLLKKKLIGGAPCNQHTSYMYNNKLVCESNKDDECKWIPSRLGGTCIQKEEKLPFTRWNKTELNGENHFMPANGNDNKFWDVSWDLILGKMHMNDVDIVELSKLIYVFNLLQNLEEYKINIIYSSWTTIGTISNFRTRHWREPLLKRAESTNLRYSNILNEIKLRWENTKNEYKIYHSSETVFDKVVGIINDCNQINLTSPPPLNDDKCGGFMCLCGTLNNEITYNNYSKIFMLDGVYFPNKNKDDIVSTIQKFGSGMTIPNNNIRLDDNLSVTKMTLLGTHDSCATLEYRNIFLNANPSLKNTPINTESDVDTFLIAQRLNIIQQLMIGVRVFDIRSMLGHDNNLWACHAMIGFGPKMTDLFDIITQHLMEKKNEFIFCILKQDVPQSIAGWNHEGTQLDETTFLKTFMGSLSSYIEEKKKTISESKIEELDNIWNFSSTIYVPIPTLTSEPEIVGYNRSLSDLTYKDIRGKCIFLPYEMKDTINTYLDW